MNLKRALAVGNVSLGGATDDGELRLMLDELRETLEDVVRTAPIPEYDKVGFKIPKGYHDALHGMEMQYFDHTRCAPIDVACFSAKKVDK